MKKSWQTTALVRLEYVTKLTFVKTFLQGSSSTREIFGHQRRNNYWKRRDSCLVWFSGRGRGRERGAWRTECQLQIVLIIGHDTLSSCLLIHFKSLFSVLETVQSKPKCQAAVDAFIKYHAVLFKFDFTVLPVMLQYALGNTRPLSILLQFEFCDLMKAPQDLVYSNIDWKSHVLVGDASRPQ